MKKFIIGFVFCLLLIGCNNTNKDPIKKVHISEVLIKRKVILISKGIDNTGVIPRRMAYIYDLNDSIFYISSITSEIWDDYFKDAQKGDTIKFY